MIKCLKLLLGHNTKMDRFLMNAFTENLVKVFTDKLCDPKLKVFILTIWKKATSNYQVMIKHLKKARAIVMSCLQVSPLSMEKVLTTRDLLKDFSLLRYSILYNLSSEFLNIFSQWDFDKYQIAEVIVEYLNIISCTPVQIKSILDRFKINSLDMNKREFVRLFQTVRTNSGFNFLWISFWIGAEVKLSDSVSSKQKGQKVC